MKILSAHNFYQEAGGEDLSHGANIQMLRDYGHPVLEYRVHNDDVKRMGKLEAARRTFWNNKTYRELATVLRKWKPDVAHFTNIFPLISPSVYRACYEFGVAVVQGLHNYRLLCPSAYLLRDGAVCEKCIGKTFAAASVFHRCYRRDAAGSLVVASMSTFHRLRGTWARCVDMYLTPSQFSKSKFLAAGFCSDELLAVKPNFLDPDPGCGTGDGDYAIFVGRLSPEKGVDVLLNAWAHVRTDLNLLVVGDGELREQVRQASMSDPRIKSIGWKPHAEVMNLIGRARCLVMPSLWYETFGRTMIEAFAKGCPVVASDIGCMAELVRHERNGLLYDKSDALALAAAVERVSSADVRPRFSEMARQTYVGTFTKEKNYPILMDVYEQAIENFWKKDSMQNRRRFHVG